MRSPLLLLSFFLTATSLVDAGKFAVSGPVLTVTLKDANPKPTPSVTEAFTSSSSGGPSDSPQRWMDLTSLRPNLFWSLQSTSPPLPNWFPSWTSLRTNVGYRYEELKRLPSFIESDLKFRSEKLKAELQVKPSFELKPKRSNLLLQATKGASYVLARFSMSHSRKKIQHDDIDWETTPTTSAKSSRNFALNYLRASYQVNFPSDSSISSLRITPSLDLSNTVEPSCELEGTTGRTLARLKLNYNNPTLAVFHAIDERNTISPEISLYNAKIQYSWNVQLRNGASIRTKVDPTTAIEVQWTDTSAADGGRWVTDFRLPLEGTTIQALASDVKVRRQFNF